MKQKIILDLCGGSGSWSRPYKESGYDVRLITLPENDVLTYQPPKSGVYGILAAPPCTEFSVLNCKAERRERKPEEGLKIVNACLRIIEQVKPVWWALENPVGYLRDYRKIDVDFSTVGVRRSMDKAHRNLGSVQTPAPNNIFDGKMCQINYLFIQGRGVESQILHISTNRHCH